MGPEMMLASALLSGAGTLYQGVMSAQAAQAQADADRQKAAIESQWAERRAKEERAASQREAMREGQKAKLAQSRLVAVAGASGSGADDPTVLNLWGDIAKEGDLNKQNVMAGGEQKASGMKYQSDLNTWSANTNADIKEASGRASLIGSVLGSASRLAGGFSDYMTPMSARYGNSTRAYTYD
jgi:hypothetical protein